jgi:hypothetical protein
MKKAAFILLLTIYGVSSFGISLKQFYCCGKLEATHIAFTPNDKQKTAEKGCCQTIYQFLKVSDTHGAATDIISPERDFMLLDLFTSVYQGTEIPGCQISGRANGSNAPPLHYGVAIFIFNCVYRL